MFKQIQKGFLLTIPVGLSAAVYGSVLGVLASIKGLTWGQLLVMDLAVFAGTAQYVMVDMWDTHIPVLEMAMAVSIINFRYLLIGASLKPLFAGHSIFKKLAIMHLVADENWAITMGEHREGKGTIWFLLGGGICLITLWSMSTIIGIKLGRFINNPELYALDFVVVAVFAALTTSLFRGKTDIVPYCTAAAAAILSYWYLPGKWYIVIGAVSGSLGAVINQKENPDGNQ